MRLISLLALFAVVCATLTTAPHVRAEGRQVCNEVYDPFTQKLEVKCRSVDEDGGGTGSGYSSPPMMWIRQGVFSGGERDVSDMCQLVPVSQGVPANFVRTSASECNLEGGSRPSREDVERWVRSLSGSLRVPAPTIQLGPEPSVNEWNMSVVGLPIWLWTDAPRNTSSSTEGEGMRIDISAKLNQLTFTMGDGKQVTCTAWTPYTPAKAGEESPTCGHTYQKPSLPKGEYTITATANWTAQWSAMGYSGTLPLRSTATRSLPVGELQAVVIRER